VDIAVGYAAPPFRPKAWSDTKGVSCGYDPRLTALIY